MFVDPAIFLAAMGITLLEISEASAVGLAISSEGGNKVFLYVALGVLIVFVIAFAVGQQMARLPIVYIRIVAGVLLLYFGLRLTRSARRAVLRSRSSVPYKDEGIEKGVFYTAFSVGLVEAFEAAIVLIALIPNNFYSTLYGMTLGLLVVVLGTVILKSQVRKIKQAKMKVVVAALLLSFSVFWFAEAVITVSDLWLVPLFIIFGLAVYFFAHRK
ncbi:MAG: hypothetical protein AMDU3_IPLC00004G0181 [Thermoplasmatales archaeon I-plasma]|jgi:Predicted membrane protein|nr:MAG: hypothetical protein AMDU3_IPLC00004G0181 [Thermoplasmatales archaeon I-plasma]